MEADRVYAVIAAAGLSRRMGQFKPLIPFCGKPVIRHLTDTIFKSGIKNIIIVTGHNASAIKACFEGASGISFCFNPEYEKSHMFDSLLIGLRALQEKAERIAFFPADVPLLLPFTIKECIGFDEDIVYPTFKTKPGHPVLIKNTAFEYMMGYNGEGGLKGAVDKYKGVKKFECIDEGIFCDADTPEDLKKLKHLMKEIKRPSRERCKEILNYFNVLQKTADHCFAVAKKAEELGEGLNRAGCRLDLGLISAGACLHDLAKGSPNHAYTAGEILKAFNMDEVSEIVLRHTNLNKEAVEKIDEALVVYYADKVVAEDRPCTLYERFLPAIAEGRVGAEINYKRALAAERLIKSRLE